MPAWLSFAVYNFIFLCILNVILLKVVDKYDNFIQ